MLKDFIDLLKNSKGIKVLIILTALDVFFGILRAIKDKDTNSTFGINGLIRKTGMLISAIVLLLLDVVIDLNFIGFIPKDVLAYSPVEFVGISTFFAILFILFESLSVLKNMYKCGIPIPKKLQVLLKRLLKEFTSEIEESKE